MSRREFTPGPWKAHFNVPTAMIPGHIVKADHGAEFPIASIWEGGGTEGKPMQIANAQLIAAAPALYEALKEIKARLREPSFVLPVKMIDAAIALAEGRESK